MNLRNKKYIQNISKMNGSLCCLCQIYLLSICCLFQSRLCAGYVACFLFDLVQNVLMIDLHLFTLGYRLMALDNTKFKISQKDLERAKSHTHSRCINKQTETNTSTNIYTNTHRTQTHNQI